MVIEFALLQNFLIAFVAAVFVVSVFVIAWEIFRKKPQTQQSAPEKPLEYKNLLKSANKHAKKLLIDTTIAAGEILSGTKRTNEHIEENMDTVLQSIAAKDIHSIKSVTTQYELTYEQKLKAVQDNMELLTQSLIENTKKEYEEKLQTFTSDLLKQGLSTQAEVEKKTAELIKIADLEINEYKKVQLEKVDEKVKNLVDKVYKDVLRVSITPKNHAELIIQALEAAKQEGMFKL